MGFDDEFVDREQGDKNIENAEYDSTVENLETNGILPNGNIPYIRSINGCGIALYGRADYHKESNSYITSLYCILGFIPIFPVKRFRVKLVSSDFYVVQSSSKYLFMWRLPLTKSQRLHVYSILLLPILFILSIILKEYLLTH